MYFNTLSGAYHYFRPHMSSADAWQRAKEWERATQRQHESKVKFLRQKAEHKYGPREMDLLRRQHEGHFFDPDTLSFFRSKIGDTVYGGNMFITSERGARGPRVYTVRRVTKGGDIVTVGEHMDYSSKAQAVRAIARIMRQTKARHSR